MVPSEDGVIFTVLLQKSLSCTNNGKRLVDTPRNLGQSTGEPRETVGVESPSTRLMLQGEQGQFGDLRVTVGLEFPSARFVLRGVEGVPVGRPRRPTVRRSRAGELMAQHHFRIH